MDTGMPRELVLHLEQRKDLVADRWYSAIAHTCYVPLSARQVRQRLGELTRKAIRLLIAEPFAPEAAQEIGSALADLHYLQPEALGGTVGVLAREISAELPWALATALQPSLAALLDSICAGFFRRSCAIVLSEQESVRDALVTELRATEYALREARDQLEERIEERTAQLVLTNEELYREIAERRRVEEALRASEERWRSLVENAPDIILTIDRGGRVLFINRPGFEEVTRGRLNQDGLAYVLPEYQDSARKSIERVFETGQSQYNELMARDSTGSAAWYANHLGPVRHKGQVVAVMIIARDITDRKTMDDMKDNLIRDVSHELRTPLAKMQMSLELLLEELEKDSIDRQRTSSIGQMVFGNVERLLQTVEVILDLSSLEAGQVVYERIEIQAEDLIQEVVAYMKPMAEAKGLGLTAEWHDDMAPIEGDPEQLFRVMMNLVDNALKFTEQGTIKISAWAEENQILVSIKDSGCGIKEENLERIFDRFYQERARYHGAGVGLTICKRIVEDHGGKIWAESPGRGKGTTLWFALPVGRHA